MHIPYGTYYAYFSSIDIYIVTVHTKYTLAAQYILRSKDINKNHILVSTRTFTCYQLQNLDYKYSYYLIGLKLIGFISLNSFALLMSTQINHWSKAPSLGIERRLTTLCTPTLILTNTLDLFYSCVSHSCISLSTRVRITQQC